MDPESNSVKRHYGQNALMARIDAALSAAGHNPQDPGLSALQTMDHLHGGGFQTTVIQVELASIAEGSHVLDAGCGIGGPSRYLVDHLGCTVDAIDLTPEFVQAAAELNIRVGLADKITVVEGSVTDLPYEDLCFDAVICQNVSMNVADKLSMFHEAFRVLKSGGIYTLSHVALGPVGDPIYPLPWARGPEASFLGAPQDFIAILEAAGFVDVRDLMEEAGVNPGGAAPAGAPEAHPAMGDDMPERLANAMQSGKEGRIKSMLIVARKP